jgi:hypothetical protein
MLKMVSVVTNGRRDDVCDVNVDFSKFFLFSKVLSSAKKMTFVNDVMTGQITKLETLVSDYRPFE